ncbi:hypothetical protein KJ780_03480 [Candidatus Micrarchaeota archaeon]|nr:hypothetical protein [Candidatus Micrarchaeota archaeon]
MGEKMKKKADEPGKMDLGAWGAQKGDTSWQVSKDQRKDPEAMKAAANKTAINAKNLRAEKTTAAVELEQISESIKQEFPSQYPQFIKDLETIPDMNEKAARAKQFYKMLQNMV